MRVIRKDISKEGDGDVIMELDEDEGMFPLTLFLPHSTSIL